MAAAAGGPEPRALFEVLGDCVALVDLQARCAVWTTGAWRERHADCDFDTLGQALLPVWQADRAAARRSVAVPLCAGGPPVDLQLVPWAAPALCLLRDAAPPPAEQALALQRHLHDRERLLFTSRSVSIGEMASTLAHEINQPIGTIANVLRGVAARLDRLPGLGDSAVAELRQGLKLAQDQAQFAARVVGRIREYTHSRQPHREPLDLQALLQECVDLLDWEFARHGVAVSLAPAPPVWVEGDAVMLQQVVVNLLRNALDAERELPRPGACVRVGVQPRAPGAAADAGEVEVAIVDNGCGISERAEDALFVPFQSNKPDGMGIGLKICRSFIELHQGRLWFTRNPPPAGGCTFHIALRQVAAPAA